MRRTQDWKRAQFKRVDWRPSDVTIEYPYGAILYWDASQGFVDLTGNQSAILIGDEYPTVTAGYALNEFGREWGFDLTTGPVRDALASGRFTLVQPILLPAMSSLTDATDYSIFGDLLFVRRDGTSGSFKLSDGTNTGVCYRSWTEGEVVTVICKCSGGVMQVGVY